MKSWLRIRIHTDPETYEGIATLLLEWVGNGMVEHRGQESPGIILEAYLPEDANTANRIEQIKHHPLLHAVPMQLDVIAEEPWAELWQRMHPPSVIDGRVIIYRPWDRIPPPTEEMISLIIEPGLAFGTGRHETTQLCIQGLLRLVQPGMNILDIGTGSGILAFIAARLGAAFVLALDHDPKAAQVAGENRALNQLNDTVHLFCGSLATVKRHSTKFDYIVANINAGALRDLLEANLASHLRSGGRLLVSGILATEEGEMTERMAARGFSPVSSTIQGEWCYIEALATKDAGTDE
ncbi:MAG: 50S ribosomal protein L11 methyltransferase [Anaerolineaceae bacterium]|nr:50S ribosomal protein L11 methyltransferase [Anaerolineaceae bacterium]